jgi:outer membrane murein-binding lipoprotein Lpp
MPTRVVSIVATATLIAACGSSGDESSTDEQLAELQAQIDQLSAENEELRAAATTPNTEPDNSALIHRSGEGSSGFASTKKAS